ncbi:MAG: lipopolysaccharide biosynthesis protein [Muribaculaceae bacterium]|nr:lipopolysaccharide biosynthesis protein [Muribaculaceae bacterium]
MGESSLKSKTVGTLKWNTIDRVSSQVIYAVVGIVLANILSKADFGLVGALAIFQAFAILFVDSGFGAALLQKKNPSDRDYSTVFWFNLAVSVGIYLLLFFCAPFIARIFQNDVRLIPLSKVMFLTFVINGLAIVQTNRLMKMMDVKMIAVSNLIALIISGGIGIGLALSGFGAWAMVWQQVSLAAVKTLILWITGKWWPAWVFSMNSLKSIWNVGISVFSSSMLNTISLNLYNFFVGILYGMVPLGVYTQAEKWSKMGSASISQVLTSSFVPLLAKVQNSISDFHRYVERINRFTSFILFPFMIGLTAVGAPLFHLLFGDKWDQAIPLFRILMFRGIFVVFISLYSNYLLSLGKSRHLFYAEILKDGLMALALAATIPFGSLTILVWGQLAASAITWALTLILTARSIHTDVRKMLSPLMPFFLCSLLLCTVAALLENISDIPLLQLLIMASGGMGIYLLALVIFKVPEPVESIRYITRK